MAVTKGHGNRNWSREEVILAFDLLVKSLPKIPNKTDDSVRLLSESFRALPIRTDEIRNDTYRNVDGVAFKMLNLNSLLTGKGLTNTSKMDRAVFAEFSGDYALLSVTAGAIQQALSEISATQPPGHTELEGDVTEEFPEGRAITKIHTRRERSASIRKKKLLSKIKEAGGLACEGCACKFEIDNAVSDAAFEVHHLIPLSSREAVSLPTKLSDLAVLCANCHRMIDRLISIQKSWIDIATFKTFLKN